MSDVDKRPTPRFRLGRWTVSPQRHRIEDGDETRRLSAKAMALLVYFSQHPERVLSKDEILKEVWRATYTSDEALSTVIYELRRVLDDNARQPQYIETIRKSGYRLVAKPARLEEIDRPASGAETEIAPLSSNEQETQSSTNHPMVFLALGLVALIVVGLIGREWTGSSEAVNEIESLAVLPLAAYLADDQRLLDTALTDMLVGDIAQACAVDVTPGLALGPEANSWTVDDALDSLGVDAVVEGAVARSGDNLWITLQLVDLRTGRMLWSATYDRQVGDELLALREVTQDAALRIRDTLGQRQSQPLPLREEAEDAIGNSQFIPQVSPE